MSLVAVLGTGSVGRAIALSLARGGANVSLVSRTPSQVEPLDGVTVISYEEATSDVDAIVIAVPGGVLEDLLATQASWLDGAFLVDATNNIEGTTYSQLALFAHYTPTARVARAWCTLGWENFLDPMIDGVPLDLAWCGPEGDDAELLTALIASTGLRPVRVGDLSTDYILEYVTRLTLSLIFGTGRSRKLGLKILEGPNFS